jgi:hypothetical protein
VIIDFSFRSGTPKGNHGACGVESGMRDIDQIFQALSGSAFRRRFRLEIADRKYLEEKGLPVVLRHASDFILRRLAAAEPLKDGKQTPWKGHPVFVAQHATATCCRGCLAKWHDIPKRRELSLEEREHVRRVIERWLRIQMAGSGTERVSKSDS